MIDLHMHTFFSDGALGPAELIRRAENAGYSVMAITDHADASNLEPVLERQLAFQAETAAYLRVRLLIGLELTHVPPQQVGRLTERARALGAQLVMLHGETVSEPVAPGTNRAGIEAGVDILAHPGLISEEDAALAAERGVRLEITSRPSHALTNGHVCALARSCGAKTVLNSDSHAPGDLLTPRRREQVALGAGYGPDEWKHLDESAAALVKGITASRSFA